MKFAHVYRHRGKHYVEADSQTQAGFWVATGHVFAVEGGDEQGLAKAIHLALEKSETGVPTPPRTANPARALLAKTGATSWRAFAKEAACVRVTLENREIRLTPYRRVSDSFEPQPDRKIKLSSDDGNLAKIVLSLFQQI